MNAHQVPTAGPLQATCCQRLATPNDPPQQCPGRQAKHFQNIFDVATAA